MMKDLRRFFRIEPWLVAVCLFCSGDLQADSTELSEHAELEFRFFGGGVGLRGREGWELWDSDVRYRFSTAPATFSPGFGIACTALFLRRSLFLMHDIQLYKVDHQMQVYDWRGPERLSFVHPGEQTKGGSFQQSSSTVGVCHYRRSGGFFRLGGGVSGFVGTHRSGWAMWGWHLSVQYGVHAERRIPWAIEFRFRQARGPEAHYAEFSPTGYQVIVGLNRSRPQSATSHAFFWSTGAGAVCWLPFLSWIATGE